MGAIRIDYDTVCVFFMLGSALLRTVCHMLWSFCVLTKLHGVT